MLEHAVLTKLSDPHANALRFSNPWRAAPRAYEWIMGEGRYSETDMKARKS
jgi:hypothetical protein